MARSRPTFERIFSQIDGALAAARERARDEVALVEDVIRWELAGGA